MQDDNTPFVWLSPVSGFSVLLSRFLITTALQGLAGVLIVLVEALAVPPALRPTQPLLIAMVAYGGVTVAAWLALYGDRSEILDDAERLVRARMIPAQIIDSPELTPSKHEDLDEYADLNERIIGSIGGMYTYPHARIRYTIDITAAGLHGLADIY